ncbi:MFS general substrate transporter [Xylaria sp. FL1042]|nr:MFS general substrate transporter [Xylaria sp. FL1042]
MDVQGGVAAIDNWKLTLNQDNAQELSLDDGDPAVSTVEPYTVFTQWQKHWINLQSSFAAMFSTLNSYIYFPALVPIAKDLHVSVALINLTVTSYLIVAAVAPAFMGDLADQGGRWPVYILMFLLMLGANVGTALQTSFPALLVLRTLQSAAYGVAPSLRPVISGSLTHILGWRSIFWFLVILQGTHMLVIILFMPETQRNISILYNMLQNHAVKTSRVDIKSSRRYYPNPLACLPILRSKDSLTVVVMYANTYAIKLTLQTSLGAQALQIYQLNYLDDGLIYLPSGVAGGIGSYMTGRFLDRNYRKAKEQLFGTSNTDSSHHLPKTSLIKSRLKGLYFLVTVIAAGTVGCGWALATRAGLMFHSIFSIMLFLQFRTGMTTASTFTMTSTLFTDLNSDRSATAQGASSIVRCLLAAAATAAIEPLAEAVGLGWCFVVYALIVTINLPLSWGLQYHRSGD